MALKQSIICHKDDPEWQKLSADQGHQLLISDTDKYVTTETLLAFQQQYAIHENKSFNLTIAMIDGKLHIDRLWVDESSYVEYKQSIETIENQIIDILESHGWTFEESPSAV